VGCIHIAALREPYGDEPFSYKTSMICYDYEPIYALGSMLGISNPEGFLKLMDTVETIGLDAMSTGVTLARATEAQKKGLISRKETMDINFDWGDYKSYMKAIGLIVRQPNEFYEALAHGIAYASSKYGGEGYALSFGGNEMPGYHTGPAAHLGVLVGARHSHLDNAGYSVDQKILSKNRKTCQEVVETLLEEEWWRQILSSLVICFFARGIYTPETVLKALQVAGFEIAQDDPNRIGKEIHWEKYRFKVRERFSLDKLHVPKRIFETPSTAGDFDEGFIREAIKYVKKEMNS
jgi:aldehyde:ferredoxin oxidoreductase